MKGKGQDDDLRMRPGRIRSRGAGARPKTFFAEDLKAGRKAGFIGPRLRSGGPDQVYAAPGQVTDIPLQEGEQLVGSGPIAAGDTARWIIGDAESGTNNAKRVHILVKPTRPDLLINLVINTDRRTSSMSSPSCWECRAAPHDGTLWNSSPRALA